MRSLVVLIVLSVATLLAPRDADACSCNAPREPCETMFSATVFVGKAISTVKGAYGMATTTFAVSETLHSSSPLGTTVKVEHSTDGNTCGHAFARGKTYVVYVSSSAGRHMAMRCSRTHLLKKNDPDVAFARAAKTSKTSTKAVIEGKVVLLEGNSRLHPGAVIRATGPTTAEATSDASGVFKLDVPPGRYQLDVISPGLRTWRGERPEIVLPAAAACSHPQVNVVWDGQIAGRLVDAAGKPVAGVEVEAIATQRDAQRFRLAATSAADGTYTIHEVQAGTYRVGVSPNGPTPTSPFTTTWLVKPVKVAKATLVKVGDLALPAPLAVRTLRISVRRKSGAVIQGASVTVTAKAANRGSSGSTDASGVLTLRELDGTDVTIRACFDGACVDEARTLSSDVDLSLTPL